ncbi:RTL1: Retrotransposon-like 1 [Crotalus adamanteus]|uniref:RTL1: Retrotransposon-like 1 n=1 Tax=Crotalus adamanteus TaxID=8729 RepID=A0AAW1B184_CROAD
MVRGVPCRLQDWFRVVTELDVGLQEFRRSPDDQSTPRRIGERPKEAGRQPPTSAPPSKVTFRCFRCNRPGHRVAECPVPAVQSTPVTQGRPGPTPKKTPDHSRVVCRVEGGTPQRPSSEVTPAVPDDPLEEYDNMDPDEDPMVSQPISPFAIPISLTSPTTGQTGEYQALIDSGCTQCLVSKGVVKKVGIRVHRLARPIHFEQVDGSLLGEAPATLVTEPVRLDMGEHWEVLRFIVVPSMTEEVILGLAWLGKWGPTIW